MTNLTTKRTVLRTLAKTLAVLLFVAPVFAQAPNAPKPSTPPFSLGIELLTDPQGVDLGPYMRSVYKSVKDKALATMPPSVASGDQGVVSIRLQIQKDGTLPALPSIVLSSRKKVLDENAIGAVSKAAPYEHLPEKLSAPSIEFRLSFYYNIAPEHAADNSR
jgi:TonB family protein